MSTTKSWTITLGENKLYTDIDILAHAFSESGGASDDPRRTDHIALDTAGETLDAHIVTRFLDHRFSDICQVVEEFNSITGSTTGSDAIAHSGYSLSLTVSTEAKNGLLEAITDLCHDYMVTGAVADYYRHIGVGRPDELDKQAAESLARIREMIYYRPFPLS